jgi:predicted AlkP superfamily phosphohydrolase/phosphomutase
MTQCQPVIFIGLEGAEPLLLEKWMASGDLPVLDQLRRRSAWSRLSAPVGFSNASTVWPSVITGVNPARHGRIWSRQLVPGTYELRRIKGDAPLGKPPIWRALGAAGKRCAIVDVVGAPLAEYENCEQICGWLVHERNGPPRSVPASLIQGVLRQFGDDPFAGRSEERGVDRGACVALCRGLVDRTHAKARYLIELLRQRRWDLVMAGFAEPHPVGHLFWHMHDPQSANHDAALRAAVGDPIKEVYRATDAALGLVLAEVDPATNVVIFAGPGMQGFASASYLLDPILVRLESRGTNGRRAGLRHWLASTYLDITPRSMRRRLRRLSAAIGGQMRKSELAGRRFFALPTNDGFGAIRINLVGREPGGKVRPGAEYDECCNGLIEDLLGVINLETGRPIVDQIVRISGLYEGQHLDCMPDLVVLWTREGSPRVVGSPKIGEVRGHGHSPRSGDHSERCLLMVTGPAVISGEITSPISCMDVAPTLGALLRVEVSGLEGKPLDAWMRPKSPILQPAEGCAEAG